MVAAQHQRCKRGLLRGECHYAQRPKGRLSGDSRRVRIREIERCDLNAGALHRRPR